VPSSADLAALVEALLLRGLRPAGNVIRDGRPGSKSAIYRVEDRALSGCEAGVSVGSAFRPGGCDLSHGNRRTRRERDGLACSCGAASGRDAGDRLRPCGAAVCGSSSRRRASARRARRKLPPGNGETPTTLAAYHRSPGRPTLPRLLAPRLRLKPATCKQVRLALASVNSWTGWATARRGPR